MTASKILWSVRVSSRSVSKGFVQSTRASGVLVLQTGTDPKIRLPARISNSVASPHFGNGIAADSSPLRRRKLAARTLERCGPLVGARALAAIFTSYEGLRAGVLNFCRPHVAAGKPSSLNSLLKHRQEPRSGIFSRFQFSPVLMWSVAHERNHRRRNGQSAVKG
jgi:hypothetical protein